MKTAVVLAAAAALSLSAIPAAHASSSSHGHDAAAHARRFSRVLRAPAPDAQPVIDLEALPAANETSLAVNGTEGHRLMKRGYSGRATFFAPGLGACGTYSSASDYIVALNEAQYGDLGAVSSWCFQTITISYGGKTAQAQVTDACPTCPYGGLDMSPALFKHFADESVGVFYMNWSSGSDAAAQKAKEEKEAADAAASSSAAAAAASSSSAAAAWASSSSSRHAAWASSSSSAQAAWLSSSSASAAAASSSSAAAAAASVSSASVASAASVASEAAAASAASASAAAAGSSLSSLPTETSTLSSATITESASSEVASATGVAKVAAQPIPAGAIGGNLDGIAQLVIAMGNVVAAQAVVAKS
ncbi:RlpA-like double-psi beta-barrel domain-containing protein [Rhodotorula paludigena]|uniref:RlpA-like double-psi beta-barrel domain-containing protein n=1 Tax=Rhodotorula paludigena TaxID=86838 RepID=UPI0031705B6E